jgi:hypothetical protein
MAADERRVSLVLHRLVWPKVNKDVKDVSRKMIALDFGRASESGATPYSVR